MNVCQAKVEASPTCWSSGSSAVLAAALGLCDVGVLRVCLAGMLERHGPQGLSLEVPGLGVEEDAAEDQGGTDGAEDGDLVAEHDDAEPDGQGVFDGAGDTARRRGEVRCCDGAVTATTRRGPAAGSQGGCSRCEKVVGSIPAGGIMHVFPTVG